LFLLHRSELVLAEEDLVTNEEGLKPEMLRAVNTSELPQPST